MAIIYMHIYIYVIVMPWPRGVMEYNRPDPEGEARGIRAVIFHNPDVAMAQLFYTIVAAIYYYSLISNYMGPALPHITLSCRSHTTGIYHS